MADLLLAVLGTPPDPPPANPSIIDQNGQPQNIRLIDAGTLITSESLIWKPGVPSTGNQFATWAELAPAIADIKGRRTVVVDTSAGAAVVTPAGTYDVNDTLFVAGGGSEISLITFAEGAHWTAINLSMERIATETAGASSVWSPPANAFWSIVQSSIQNTANAAPFLHCLTSIVSVVVRDGLFGTGNAVASVNAAGSLQIAALDGASIHAGAVVQGDAPGGSLTIQYDGASMDTVSASQVPAPTLQNFDPRPTFVFKPGAAGTLASNVYLTWAALAADAAKVPGPKWIEVDDTGGAAHVTTGGPYDLDQVTFVGTSEASGAVASLTFDDGATFTAKTLTLENINVVPAGHSSAWTIAGGAVLFAINSSVQQGVGTTPWVHVNNGGTLIVNGIQNVLLGDGTHASIAMVAGSAVTMLLFCFATLSANAVSGGAGTLTVIADASCTVSATQAPAPTIILADLATQVAYTPATAGNWNPAPTQVAAALDALAKPNFVQAAGNTGTGTGTITVTTGNITKAKNGQMNVRAVCSGVTTAATTVTLQLVRDAATNIGNPIVVTTLSAGDGFTGAINFIDTAPDAAAHTYKLTATAGAGNLTVAASSAQIGVAES